jgi:hypothetical protein
MSHAPLPRRGLALATGGLLAACAGRPPPPTAALPVDPALGLVDPARQAILHAAHAFASPTPMAGRPWEAAQAISEVEFLAIELNQAPRWIEMSPLAKMAFDRARPEWRGALGIAPDAPPQAVIDAMTRVRMGFGAQDAQAAAAALAPPLVTPGGPAGIARLNALPPLPMTARAASMAQEEMWRMQRQGQRDRWPG